MGGEKFKQHRDYDPRAMGAMASYYASDPEIEAAIKEYADEDGVIRGLKEIEEFEWIEELREEQENDPLAWQSECFEKIRGENNVILSSPTGSGKTRVFLEWAREKQERAETEGKHHTIYITAPIKALSNQRFRELRKQGVKVGLETGDIKDVPKEANYICCTQEIYTNKYLTNPEATLIMDEFHYIFEDGRRARTYIDALNKSKAENILLASATFGDTEKFQNYVNHASERRFFNYENKKRITSLKYQGEITPEEIEDALVVTFSAKNCRAIAEDLYEQREKRSEEKREEVEMAANMMKIEDERLVEVCKDGVAYYFGSMLPKEKLFVEQLFEKRLVDTVVGTDALALGVNFPVKKVIFTQLAKYYDGPISKNLFEQLSGRAGRKGYFDEGEIYYCDFRVESYGYETPELFEEILNSKNEDAVISLRPNMKDLLTGKVTVEDEVNFISRFSTNQYDKEKLKVEISEMVDQVKNYLPFPLMADKDNEDFDDSIDEKEKENLNQEFKENIAAVYFDEFDTEDNCLIFKNILEGFNSKEIVNTYCRSFSDLLQFRKYFRQLPRKYRRNIDFYGLEQRINEIDETALQSGRGEMSQFLNKNQNIGEKINEQLLS